VAFHGHIEVAQVLLAAGADLNTTNRDGTPLHFAAYKGRAEVAQILLAAGADVNVRDKFGCTPLDLAQQAGHRAFVVLLQERESEPLTKSAARGGGAGDQ